MPHKSNLSFLGVTSLIVIIYSTTTTFSIEAQEASPNQACYIFGFLPHSCPATPDEVLEAEAEKAYRKAIRYDSEGIPYYDYGVVGETDIGLQRNPLTISTQALEFYGEYKMNSNNETARQYFINNADWLVNNAERRQSNNGSF